MFTFELLRLQLNPLRHSMKRVNISTHAAVSSRSNTDKQCTFKYYIRVYLN